MNDSGPLHIVGCLGFIDGVDCSCDAIRERAAVEKRDADRARECEQICAELATVSTYAKTGVVVELIERARKLKGGA